MAGSPNRRPLDIPPSLALDLSELTMNTDVLGSGGFASVVSGELKPNPSKGRPQPIPVAIKVMEKSKVSRTSFSDLQTEINICAQLRHPCIINTLGAIEDENSIYIVMDKASGGELLKYIKKFGLEDMPLVAPNFIGEVVLGLEYMANHGVIHRDLKPENLLLTEEYHVKIADFGTACKIDDAANNGFTGTPNYVSPEVLSQSKASRVSDMWALGCIVYQLFVGSAPFHGDSQYLVMQNIKERKFNFPPGERYFPTAARDLVDRLLTSDPTKRLGANGFDSVKKHPFFANVKWDKILTTSNVTHLNANHSKQYERYLFENEQVVYASKIVKKRHLSTKLRILILTDYPRLFYADPDSEVIKGQVPWSDELYATANDDTNFVVHVPDRDYIFTDSEKRATIWVSRVNDLVKSKKGAAKKGGKK